jgi:hypothetical protein
MALQTPDGGGERAKRWYGAPLAALLVAVFATLLYLPTGEHGFTQDDHLLIGGSEALRSGEGGAASL